MVARLKLITAVAVTSGFVVGATVVLSGASRAVFDLTDSTGWVDNEGVSSVTQLDPGGVASTVPLGPTVGAISTIEIDGVAFAIDDDGIRRIDPKTLDVTERAEFDGGEPHVVVAGGGRIYAMDRSTGTIIEYDPETLVRVGTAVTVGGTLGDAVVDGDGVLWVPQLDTGVVLGIDGSDQIARHEVSRPHAELQLTVVSDDVVLVDRTESEVRIVTTDAVGEPRSVPVGTSADAFPTSVESGSTLPMLDENGNLIVIDVETGDVVQGPIDLGDVRDHDLATPQVAGERVYIGDQTTGMLLVIDIASGTVERRIELTGEAGPLDVVVRGEHVYVNDPTARARGRSPPTTRSSRTTSTSPAATSPRAPAAPPFRRHRQFPMSRSLWPTTTGRPRRSRAEAGRRRPRRGRPW